MPIDIVFIAVFGYGFWQGYSRGIIGTVFNLLAYIFGVTLAFKITPITTTLLERMFNSENPTMFLAAFIVNLVFIMFILRMAARSMEGVFQALYLGVINQVVGGVFMGFVSILIYSIILWFMVKVQFLNELTISESKTYPILKDLPPKAKAFALRIKPFAEEAWGTSMNWMNRLETYGEEKTKTKGKVYIPEDTDTNIIEDDPLEESAPKRKPVPVDEPIIEE